MEMQTNGLKLNIGDNAPDFDLPGVDGKKYNLASFRGKKVLCIIFMCNHCPYVQAYISRIKALQAEFGLKGLQVVGINANDEINYPDDSFEKMKVMHTEKKLGFPYLRDADQSVARKFDAQCTPEAFVLDIERKLRYHGRIDDNYKDENNVGISDLRSAVDAVIHNQKVPIELTHAVGCSIKWK